MSLNLPFPFHDLLLPFPTVLFDSFNFFVIDITVKLSTWIIQHLKACIFPYFIFRDMLIEQLMREINELREHLDYLERDVSALFVTFIVLFLFS